MSCIQTYLSKETNTNDIIKIVKANCENVKYELDNNGEGKASFKYKGKDGRIYFYLVSDKRDPDDLCSLQKYIKLKGNIEEIIKTILEYFGGYIEVIKNGEYIDYYRVGKTKFVNDINIDTYMEYLLKELNKIEDVSLQNIIRQVIFSNSIDEKKLKEIIELNRPEMIGKLI